MKNEPRPEIEYHPHIQMLIDTQERKTKDKVIYQNRDKANAEREEEIIKAKPVDIVEMFCDWCDEDFANIATKHMETDWSNTSQRVAYYKSKHDCGNWCVRHITDKNRDPYWMESRKVALDRGLHHDSLIQEFEDGYQLLYGRKNT